MSFTWILIINAICGVIGFAIGGRHAWKAAAICLLTGPLGIVIVMLVDLERCQQCGTRLSPSAKLCPGCNYGLSRIRVERGRVYWPCNHCGSETSSGTEHAGETTQCRSCKGKVTVPERSEHGALAAYTLQTELQSKAS